MAKGRNIKKVSKTRPRYKNDAFLKALGAHCRKIRKAKGYSIDRLYKESDQLSPASIDRLERGHADSQILVLVRYAQALQVPLNELFAFTTDSSELTQDSRIVPYEESTKPPLGYVPVFPLQVAAGSFSFQGDTSGLQPSGWIDAGVRGHSDVYFASFVRGESMEPLIQNGSLCLFRKYGGGSRQGKIFLVRARGLQDPETGEAFVVKKYQRQTLPRSTEDENPTVIHLLSINPKYPPIVLVGLEDDSFDTVAEFVRVL